MSLSKKNKQSYGENQKGTKPMKCNHCNTTDKLEIPGLILPIHSEKREKGKIGNRILFHKIFHIHQSRLGLKGRRLQFGDRTPASS